MCQWVQASAAVPVEFTNDWHERLQDMRKGQGGLQQVWRELHCEVDAAFETLCRESEHLTSQAKTTVEAFTKAMRRLGESGRDLHAAAADMQHNRETVFRCQPVQSRGVRQLAEELAACRETVLTRVRENGEILTSTSQTLAGPHRDACECAHSMAKALKKATELLDHEGELLRVLAEQGQLSTNLAKAMLRHYTTTLEAVQKDGQRLKDASQDLTRCRKAYRNGMIANRTILRNAESSLQCDQKAIFSWAWEHVSNGRRCDREFILAVVSCNGELLEGAPEEFRGDREVVLAAVRQSCGWALQFAARKMRMDREVVLAAVRRSGWALEHADESMKRDREVVLAAVQTDGEALEFASEEIRADREVALAAVQRSGACAWHSVAPALRSDPEVATAAVRENGLALEHVCEALRADRSVVLAAVTANGLALQHAAPPLKADKGMVTAAVRANPAALQFAAPWIQGNVPVVKAAIEQDGQALRFASEDLRHNRKVVLAAVQRGGLEALQYASPPLRTDPKMLLAAREQAMSSQAVDLWQQSNPV